MKRYYFRPNEFHDNPVVNMILQKRADGLCEAASGLATVFRIVTDFDIALLYCDKFATPSYLLDESTACMSDSAMVNFIKSLSVESSITPADVLEAYDEVMPTIQDMNNLELASLAKSLLRYISKTEVSKNQETNAISFVNYLVSTNDRELLVMLSMYYKNNMIELDTTTPALSDVLFKVLSNTKYGRKN